MAQHKDEIQHNTERISSAKDSGQTVGGKYGNQLSEKTKTCRSP